MQVRDGTGMLETYAEVDKSLVKLNGNEAAFRLSEDRAFIEGMNQTMAQTLFYSDTLITDIDNAVISEDELSDNASWRPFFHTIGNGSPQ